MYAFLLDKTTVQITKQILSVLAGSRRKLMFMYKQENKLLCQKSNAAFLLNASCLCCDALLPLLNVFLFLFLSLISLILSSIYFSTIKCIIFLCINTKKVEKKNVNAVFCMLDIKYVRLLKKSKWSSVAGWYIKVLSSF